MKRLSKEQIERARQVDLLHYFQQQAPQELVRVGPHTYATKTHGSMRIGDNGLWNWFSGGVGGKSALDYLIRVEQMGFAQAVEQLTGCSLPPPEQMPCPPAEKPAFHRPRPDRSMKKAYAYLCSRGIHTEVIGKCARLGILYQQTGHEHAHCVFLGLDETGTPRSASLRSCWGKFRQDVLGSEKKYGFCIPPKDPACTAVSVFEAPIDAMSAASMEKLAQKDWENRYYLALGGLNYRTLDTFLEMHPQVRQLRFCLDQDEPGRAFAEKMMQRYDRQGWTLEDAPPPVGKDYNDTLRWMHKAEKQPTKEQQKERERGI